MIGKLTRRAAIAIALTVTGPAVASSSDFEAALAGGGERLSSEEIADLIVGKTVSAKLGDKRFLFFYGPDNVLSGQLVGGNWSDEGFYGITDDDRVCVSMTKDTGRLRCLTLVRQGDQLRKYTADGSASFELLEFQNGKAF